VLPAGTVADVDRGTWPVPPVFDLVRRLGDVPWTDLEATLNMGVGMVAVVAADAADSVLAHAAERGLPSWTLGTVRSRLAHDDHSALVSGTKGVHGGAVHLTGGYR
jgi:phosphoribosylformylglycinamidine cyclo-ligase